MSYVTLRPPAGKGVANMMLTLVLVTTHLLAGVLGALAWRASRPLRSAEVRARTWRKVKPWVRVLLQSVLRWAMPPIFDWVIDLLR